jgi:hypothetical protein
VGLVLLLGILVLGGLVSVVSGVNGRSVSGVAGSRDGGGGLLGLSAVFALAGAGLVFEHRSVFRGVWEAFELQVDVWILEVSFGIFVEFRIECIDLVD